jgi:hypothetical protein
VPSQSSSTPLHVSAPDAAFCTQLSHPALHVVVPAEQIPGRPVLHAAPPPGFPSSVAPSQSSSTPLQVSAAGDVVWTQVSPPPLHVVVPDEQIPGAPVVQAAPPPGLPWSIEPSQSSSMPLHVSAVDVPGVHVCGTPATQFWTVTWQAPVPQLVVPSPSSVCPLQSSSALLQVSGLDGTLWMQVTEPVKQAVTPAAQMPGRPVLHVTPPPGSPLSAAPSQSSSVPLQTSGPLWTFWTQAREPP